MLEIRTASVNALTASHCQAPPHARNPGSGSPARFGPASACLHQAKITAWVKAISRAVSSSSQSRAIVPACWASAGTRGVPSALPPGWLGEVGMRSGEVLAADTGGIEFWYDGNHEPVLNNQDHHPERQRGFAPQTASRGRRANPGSGLYRPHSGSAIRPRGRRDYTDTVRPVSRPLNRHWTGGRRDGGVDVSREIS